MPCSRNGLRQGTHSISLGVYSTISTPDKTALFEPKHMRGVCVTGTENKRTQENISEGARGAREKKVGGLPKREKRSLDPTLLDARNTSPGHNTTRVCNNPLICSLLPSFCIVVTGVAFVRFLLLSSPSLSAASAVIGSVQPPPTKITARARA